MWRMWLMRFNFRPLRHTARVVVVLAACLVGCSGANHPVSPYGAHGARVGESLAVLGWNMAVSNLRWDGDYVLIDVDASPADPHAPHAKAEDMRFVIYGPPAHPLDATRVRRRDATTATEHEIAHPLGAH